MRLLKNRSMGFYICFVLLLTLATARFAIAHANSGPNTATLKAGGLTEANATNQVSIQVQTKVNLVSYSLPITVIDARGSGSGWNLSITSTSFSSSSGQLPNNASSISGVSVSCGTKSTCTKPMNTISYPLVIPADRTPPPSVKFFNATLKSGLGKFSLAMTVNVTIPSSAKSGTYISTVYLTIANGP